LLENASNRGVIFLRREIFDEVWQGIGVLNQDLNKSRQGEDTGQSYPRANVSSFIGGVVCQSL
jgi:hypothetical protein